MCPIFSMSSKKSRVTISKTPAEWKTIDDKLSQLKRANFNSFLRGKLHALAKDYKRSHKDICESIHKREVRREYVDPDDLKIIELISLKTGLSVAQIVNQIIIEPLLHDKPTSQP